MRRVPLRFFAYFWIGLLAAASAPASRGQELESGYGPLPVFEFHSGFWINLHHFLYHEARVREAAKNLRNTSGENSAPVLKLSPGSQISLSPSEQQTWNEAIAYYAANYAHTDLLVNLDLILLKDQLGEFEDCNELTGKRKSVCNAGLPGNIGPILEAAAPIYRAHWWADQDRSNRRWVIRVAPLVREQGVGLAQRLADVYQTKWPKQKIRVEVSAFANGAGAYTTLDPLRVTIASTDERNQGPDALLVLFHEASHGIAVPVETAISRECRQRDKPIPRDLWHALIVYTTEEVLSPIIEDQTNHTGADATFAEKQKPNSVPYVLSDTLTQRGWEDYHLKLTLYWQPYLDGKVNFEDSIAHLVSSL
jgi:hypothetical protein